MKLITAFLMMGALSIMATSTMALEAGDLAPDFSAKNQDGKRVKLSDFRGKPVLLYFYPKDDTPGCTKEACALRDDFSAFRGHGAVVLGISRQDEKSHQKFRAKYELPFDLLVDADGSIASSMGVSTIPVLGLFKRQSVLIGPDGKVMKVYKNVDPESHSDEVLRDISAIMQRKAAG